MDSDKSNLLFSELQTHTEHPFQVFCEADMTEIYCRKRLNVIDIQRKKLLQSNSNISKIRIEFHQEQQYF
jgi:hypothetical protein